jgi:carboxypeptidase-like protein
MKWSLCLIICLFAVCSFSFSQSSDAIKGRVTDNSNGAPIANCSVFINSSSRGTITDAKGEFVLKNIPQGKFDLVISSIGYETYVYTYPGNQQLAGLKITLKPKAADLSAVTVFPFVKHGWQVWGKTFIENFIGATANASDCTLKNYKALHFRFSKKQNRLTVSSDEPLIIENKALGYTIRYQLEEFYCDFNTHITLYLGYPLFQEMSATRKKQARWEQERKKAYYGSITHFMKCLYNGELAKNGFQIIRTIKAVNLEKQRVKELYKTNVPVADTFQVQQNGDLKRINAKVSFPADSVAYYSSVLSQTDSFDKYLLMTTDSLISIIDNGTKSLFFTGKLHIIFKDAQGQYDQSEISLVTPMPVGIDKNGNRYPPQEMLTTGYWGVYEKVANELPTDYNYDE